MRRKNLIVLITVFAALVLLIRQIRAIPRVMEGYGENLPPIIPGIGRASFTASRRASSRVLVHSEFLLKKPFHQKSDAHVNIQRDRSGNIKLNLAQYPNPYPAQRGGSCVGHAMGQLIRYCKWRHKCNTKSQCLSWDPVRPCPYYLWFIGRCLVQQSPDLTRNGPCFNDFGIYLLEGLKVAKKEGYIVDGRWSTEKGVKIADTPDPWLHVPSAKLRNTAKMESNRNFQIHQIPERSYYNVLLSGHAILVGVDIGTEDLLKTDGMDFGELGLHRKVRVYSGALYGGHAMLIVGAIIHNGVLYYALQNSWGDGWPGSGSRGLTFGYMSRYDYLRRTGNGSGSHGYTLSFNF